MKQGEYYIKIDGDELRKSTCIQEMENGICVCESEVVLTKKAFIECYNKWIKGEEE